MAKDWGQFTRLALTIFSGEEAHAFLLGTDRPRCDPHHSKRNILTLIYNCAAFGAGSRMPRQIPANIEVSRTRCDLDDTGAIFLRRQPILS